MVLVIQVKTTKINLILTPINYCFGTFEIL